MGTVVLATDTIATSPISRGIAALIAALEADAGGLVRRALSTPTATYLGRVSYGTPTTELRQPEDHPTPR